MKNLLKITYLILAAFFLMQCSKEYKLPDNLVVKDFVWKGLNAYYLHQDQIADLSDRRFNSDQELNAYLSEFSDFNTLFNSLLLSTDSKSRLVEDLSNIGLEQPRSGFLNGMEFGIIEDPNTPENVLGYVTHILPNSDAAGKNITRGEFFNAVDAVQLTKTNFLDLLINGANSFNLNMVNFDGTLITPTTKIVTLERQSYDYNTSFLEDVITEGTDKIGYLIYNNNFSKSAITRLNNTFLGFKNQSVNKLILDLRYNIGGGAFAKDVSILGSLITEQSTDEIFIKEQWNMKAQPWFMANEPDSLLTKFSTNLNATTPLNSLNVTDLYIILNGNNFTGSSAVELLINSLNPHITVHTIGTKTRGNNTGAISLYNSEDYNFDMKNETHTVAIQPIVLSFLNKNDQTYENGFIADVTLCANEDLRDLGTLGTSTEPILERVLEYVSSGNKGVTPDCNEYIYVYNSINGQRPRDKGVFINQNLPNIN